MKTATNKALLCSLCLALTLAAFRVATVHAADATVTTAAVDGWEMLVGLFGGLALFLYGMERMTEALKAAASQRLKEILESLTGNRFAGVLTGAAVTAVIQSSSVTTVLLVGFVSAGLLTLNQSIGVIMGANIGTTVTAQIIAFKVTRLALVFIATGFAVHFLAKRETLRQYGMILFGLGLVFFGMTVMGEAMEPLRSYPPFIELMHGMQRPLLGIMVGALFTALIQSSSATTGIVIVMASQGFVTLGGGIALALGANIGTCVTALLSSLGKPRVAQRVALVHVLFNVVGVLLWVALIDQLAWLARLLSPEHAELTGLARMAAETPRQIANANTLFNLLNTLTFIGFTPFVAKGVERLLPDRPPQPKAPPEPARFLDRNLISTPTLALEMARREVGHLGQVVLLMLAETRQALEKRNREMLMAVRREDDAADYLHDEINVYLSRVGKQRLTEQESRDYFRISQATALFESIGDVLETDLVLLGERYINNDMRPSSTMQEHLFGLYESVFQGLEAAVRAVTENEEAAAKEILDLRPAINRRVEAVMRRQAESLAVSDDTRLQTLKAEFDLADKLKRIYSLCKRIARLWLPDA